MNKFKHTVLVSGVGGPAGINAARLLRAAGGVRIIGADIDPLAAGQSFVDTFLLAPRVADEAVYLAWLQTTIATEAVTVFLPTVHEELPLVVRYRNHLPYTVISDERAVTMGDDKVALYAWMATHMPESMIPWCLLKDWSPDWLVDEVQFMKPRRGRGARGCTTITKADLVHLQATGDGDNTIVMAFMPGTEWTVDAYRAHDGTMVYVVPRERVGLAGGISIKGRTVKHALLEALTTELATALSCYGPICVQWRADAAGVPRLLEINPRLSGGLPITVAAGVNPITAILAEASGETPVGQPWQEVTVVGHFEYITL